MDVENLIDEVIGREGGYSNHPADRGGATRWGVTEKVARAHGYRGDMRSFPRGEAVAIYRRIYWSGPVSTTSPSSHPGLRPNCSTPESTWGLTLQPALCSGR
jgi:lysozyme family protein